MQNDEKEIRELVAEWHKHAAVGDLEKLLSLMTDDIIFYIDGQPPIRGKKAFAAGFGAATQRCIESSATRRSK